MTKLEEMDLTPADVYSIAMERENDLVVRCTTAQGRVVEYLPVSVEGAGSPIWIEHWKGEARSLTVKDETVVNTIKRCNPDYELIREKDSHVGNLSE